MKILVQNSSEYPEIYEVTKVLADLYEDGVFEISLESPEYVIKLRSRWNHYLEKYGEVRDEDSYDEWLEDAESAYNCILHHLKDNGCADFRKGSLDNPLTYAEQDNDLWEIDIDKR